MPLTQAIVVNPATSNVADGNIVNDPIGRQNDQLFSQVHGKYYTAGYRNKLFRGSTAAAGQTIPASNSTSPTFMLYNPIGSGINIELVRYTAAVNNAAHVVSSVMLGIITNLVVAPTVLTALTTGPALLGGSGVPAGLLYSAGTLAAAATVFFSVGAYGATALTDMNGIDFLFDGMLALGPGSLVHVCGTAAQSQAASQSFVWAEWPA